jgi:hypothetical protein
VPLIEALSLGAAHARLLEARDWMLCGLAGAPLYFVGVGGLFGCPARPTGARLRVGACARHGVSYSCRSLLTSVVEGQALLQTVDDGEVPAVGRGGDL